MKSHSGFVWADRHSCDFEDDLMVYLPVEASLEKRRMAIVIIERRVAAIRHRRVLNCICIYI